MQGRIKPLNSILICLKILQLKWGFHSTLTYIILICINHFVAEVKFLNGAVQFLVKDNFFKLMVTRHCILFCISLLIGMLNLKTIIHFHL